MTKKREMPAAGPVVRTGVRKPLQVNNFVGNCILEVTL
jgi:hypothetical protein